MATPLIVGCDLSSKYLALVAKHPITPTAAVVKYPLSERKADTYRPESAGEALACMYEYVEQITPMAIPGAERIAYVELPLVGRGGATTTIKQAFVNGVVQAVFVSAGFRVEFANVQTWKKVVCGNGHADKAQVGRHLANVWPIVHNACNGDNDLWDAASICLYGGEIERRRNA